MSIYTKTGDDGTTALFGGRRVIKSDSQVKAYGSVDELSSSVGLLISKDISLEDKDFLTGVQNTLYIIMSMLSGAQSTIDIDGKVKQLEKRIDRIDEKLPKLTRFILPQGNELTSFIHITRTICRRAEREVVSLSSQSSIIYHLSSILKYLNRLSDFLFVLARYYNKKEIFARR